MDSRYFSGHIFELYVALLVPDIFFSTRGVTCPNGTGDLLLEEGGLKM